jgi:small conductance mechanosensitive channel
VNQDDTNLGSEEHAPRRAEDPTRASDIHYYRQSALSKVLREQALEGARRAQREVLILIPLVVGIVLLWRYREDVFGTDVPVRIATGLALAVIGWRFARDVGRVMGPRLLSRFDPGTASTVAFLVQVVTLFAVAILAFRVVGVRPGTLAVGGAVTAVVLGLAAQSTLGNLIAGSVLLTARPFRAGERIRMQGGSLGTQLEGTVASIGLIYTTLARGEERILIPNNVVLGATILPVRQPTGIDLRARLPADIRPSDLQTLLRERVRTPTRDHPHIALEEFRGDEVIVHVEATPVSDEDGPQLADEVLAVLSDLPVHARSSS